MILEIIADAGELKERTSSYEIFINKDIDNFLKSSGLDFLVEYFEEHPKLTLKDLYKMDDEQLEKILEGNLYVKRFRDELSRFKFIE
jgi:hypothetical protein